MKIEQKTALLTPEQRAERNGWRFLGYSASLAMNPEIYSIVLLRAQRLSATHLRQTYPGLREITLKRMPLNRFGLKEIDVFVFGDFPRSVVRDLLEKEVAEVIGGKVLVHNVIPMYEIPKENGRKGT